MARNPRRIYEALDQLYAELPSIDCQGYCSDSCGPIQPGDYEQRRIEGEAGIALECSAHENGFDCSMLTPDRRCSVYAARPMICRLWGLTEDLRCPYGCRPSRELTVEEGYAFLARAYEIAGVPSDAQWAELAGHLKGMINSGVLESAAPFMRAHHGPSLQGRAHPRSVLDR